MDGSDLIWNNATCGEPIWLIDDELAWRSGTVGKAGQNEVVVKFDGGEEVKVELDKQGHTGKGWLLLPRDVGPKSQGLENMDNLTHLNEASILHNVCTRFSKKLIYTRTGPILVAMNPFEWLPIYGQEFVDKYKSCSDRGLEDSEPHCFAEAEKTYRKLVGQKKSQSLIICGESGAGKTETTKLMLQYLSNNYTSSEQCIADQIMKSNPLMEAFGNAKTLKNNNSSRFGKFIRLNFDNENCLQGAHVDNYLLEKSRTVHQNKGERNYHIFYQLCKGATSDMRVSLGLSNDCLQDFYYLNQSGCNEVDGVNDAQDFELTKSAMGAVGINAEEQEEIFRIVAGILHLGNLVFGKNERVDKTETEETKGCDDSSPISHACRLFKCEEKTLFHALKHKYVNVNGKSIESPLDKQGAENLRDALAKGIFENLFTYIVHKINTCLGRADHGNTGRFIGVLDIYGFESFDTNGFEQLLINFANEKLQSLFNEQVFQAEEKTYNAEGVPFSRQDLPNNEQCIKMIQGMFKLMHDECLRMGSGSDQGLVNQLTQTYKSHSDFQVCGPRSKRKRTTEQDFVIVHYAGEIIYTCDQFVAKNKDTLYSHLKEIFAESPSPLLSELFGGTPVNSQNKLQETVAKRFSRQVTQLTEIIRETGPSFVRCIKTNNKLIPGTVERQTTLRQLKYAGVVAALEMRRAGYPNRLEYKEFCLRCRAFLPRGAKLESDLWVKHATYLLTNTSLAECKDGVALGKTKVFLRADVLHTIDGLVQAKVTKQIIAMQTVIRQYVQMRRFQLKRKCAIFCQTRFRGRRDRKLFAKQIEEIAAKRAWIISIGRYKSQLKKLEQSNHACDELLQAVSSEGFRDYVKLALLESSLKSASVKAEEIKKLCDERTGLATLESTLLGNFEKSVLAAEALVEGCQKRAATFNKSKNKLAATLDELEGEFLLFQNAEKEKELFFRNEKISDSPELREIINNFCSGYQETLDRLATGLSDAKVGLETGNLAQAESTSSQLNDFLAQAHDQLEQAVCIKEKMDARVGELRAIANAEKSRAVAIGLQTKVGLLSQVDDMMDDLNASIGALFAVLYPLDESMIEVNNFDAYDSDDETDDTNDKLTADGFVDLDLAEQRLEEASEMINQAEKLSSIFAESSKHREDTVKHANQLCKDVQRRIRDLRESQEQQLLDRQAIELLFGHSTLISKQQKLESEIEAISAKIAQEVETVDELGESTQAIEVLASKVESTCVSVVDTIHKTRERLDAAREAHSEGRAALLPALKCLQDTRALAAKYRIVQRKYIANALECVEKELFEANEMLVFKNNKIPGKRFVASIVQQVANAVQVTNAAHVLVQDEVNIQIEQDHAVKKAHSTMCALANQLGTLEAKLARDEMFNLVPVGLLCKASCCGIEVCAQANKVTELRRTVECSLARATSRISELHANVEDDKLEIQKLVNAILKAVRQAGHATAELDAGVAHLSALRSEEIQLLYAHEESFNELKQRFSHAQCLYISVGFDRAESPMDQARHTLARYEEAVCSLLPRYLSGEEEFKPTVTTHPKSSMEDSINTLLFIRADPIQVLREAQLECMYAMDALDVVVETEKGYLAKQEELILEREKRQIEKAALAEQEAVCHKQHMEEVRRQSLEKLGPVRKMVAILAQVCTFCEERLEGQLFAKHSSATIAQVLKVESCLSSVEQAIARGDPGLAEKQIEIAASHGLQLENILFSSGNGVGEPPVSVLANTATFQRAQSTFDRDTLSRHSVSDAENARIRLQTSGNTLTEIQDRIEVESCKLRALSAEINLFEFKSQENAKSVRQWRLLETLGEAKAALDCTTEKLAALSRYPVTTFVTLQCFSPSDLLSNKAQSLKADLDSLLSQIEFAHAKVQKCKVSFERNLRDRRKKQKEHIRIKRVVLRYVCPPKE